MLGRELIISDWNTAMETATLWSRGNLGCCSSIGGSAPPLADAVEQQLQIKTMTKMGAASLSISKGKKVRNAGAGVRAGGGSSMTMRTGTVTRI